MSTDEAYISEHGRLPRPLTHPSFDPFRRRQLSAPVFIRLATRALSLILIPFRLLVALISITISYAIVRVFGPRITEAQVRNFEVSFLPAWRRRIVVFATHILARGLLLALGFWSIEGEDHPEYDAAAAKRATIISNHSSLADPCLLAYLHAPAFVAKSHVWMIPGVGMVGAAQHAFYIDRMHGTAVSITEKIAERQRLLDQSRIPLPQVAIFPEGTTTNGHHLLRFRTGAFVAGKPVVPVLIKYDYKFFSPSYETINTGRYLIGLLSQVRNRVRYYRLPVYYPSLEERNDPVLFANNVRKLTLEESHRVFGEKLIPSDSNFVDKLEYHSLVRGTKLKKGLRLNMVS